jgi:hypothetical protein
MTGPVGSTRRDFCGDHSLENVDGLLVQGLRFKLFGGPCSELLGSTLRGLHAVEADHLNPLGGYPTGGPSSSTSSPWVLRPFSIS